MTTVMGIKGYDPLRKKEYIIFAGDSEWNLGSRSIRYNAKKIFTNNDGNLMLAYAGGAVLQKETVDEKHPEIIIAAERFLSKEHNSTQETIKELKKLDKITNQGNRNNGYTFANKTDLKLNWYSKGKKNNSMVMYALGTGAKKLRERNLVVPRLKMFDEVDEEKIYSEMTSLLKASFDLISQASAIDEATGGFFNFGLLTRESAMIFEEFAPMYNSHTPDELFEIGKHCLIEKLSSHGINVENLDDLVLI